jgi:hypothetical protein
MMQLGDNISTNEQLMADEVRTALADRRFAAVTANDVRGTGDYLMKIVNLIRGCGFAIAVFSDQTPARTLANIFFEVGVAGVFGKPVQLVLTGTSPAPSDFVRTEWVAYKPRNLAALRDDLRGSIARIDELSEYYRAIGDVALEAERPDLELVFERYKQAVLIGDDDAARTGIERVRDLLVEARRVEGRDDMASHRERLHRAASEFLRMLPARTVA